ncbi:MAG: AbrB/MazE/SpoVT family DNA-binding domain-containing protein [Terriglobia bacterium]
MQRQGRITSKGQITVPHDIRRELGIRPGDSLLFESDGSSVHVRRVRTKSPFAKYRAIGNPGMPSGKKGIRGWLRELRGQ